MNTALAVQRRTALEQARLYMVCDALPGGRELAPFLSATLGNGVDIVQLRDKRASDDELVAAAAVFRSAAREHGALFILNDRPDLVDAVRADGVHVGQEDTPVAEARALVGPDRIVGLSTHSPEQVDAAAGADYIAVGPVHATPTKPGRPAVGLALVHYAAGAERVPWFAIGGIDRDNVPDVAGAGARRIVVVRALTDARDPGAEARALRRALPSPHAKEASVGTQ